MLDAPESNAMIRESALRTLIFLDGVKHGVQLPEEMKALPTPRPDDEGDEEEKEKKEGGVGGVGREAGSKPTAKKELKTGPAKKGAAKVEVWRARFCFGRIGPLSFPLFSSASSSSLSLPKTMARSLPPFLSYHPPSSSCRACNHPAHPLAREEEEGEEPPPSAARTA